MSNESFAHQDYRPIVLRAPKKPTQLEKGNSQVDPTIARLRKVESAELGKSTQVNKLYGQSVQRIRIARGYKTQKDLALAAQIPQDIISKIESGNLPANVGTIVTKLRRWVPELPAPPKAPKAFLEPAPPTE
jgi:ribosome-binding protein aMBF1 (putative translation factor)